MLAMSSDTGEGELSTRDIKKIERVMRASRGEEDQQVIIKEIHHAGDKLNTIILSIAGSAISLLMVIGLWQVERIIEKMDNFGNRITRIETKLGIQNHE